MTRRGCLRALATLIGLGASVVEVALVAKKKAGRPAARRILRGISTELNDPKLSWYERTCQREPGHDGPCNGLPCLYANFKYALGRTSPENSVLYRRTSM